MGGSLGCLLTQVIRKTGGSQSHWFVFVLYVCVK